jgi:hypothetical protein
MKEINAAFAIVAILLVMAISLSLVTLFFLDWSSTKVLLRETLLDENELVKQVRFRDKSFRNLLVSSVLLFLDLIVGYWFLVWRLSQMVRY